MQHSCEENRFCKTLSPDVRAQLCAGCKKRNRAKGQIMYRAEVETDIVLMVEGVMINSMTDFSQGMLEPEDSPAFFISTNGLLLFTDNLFNEEPNARYEYISYICLTDVATATFNRTLIRQLFDQSNEFAIAMYQNILIAAGEACEFAAVLRAPDVAQSVRYLLTYAMRKGFRLTQQQIADITGHSRLAVTWAITRLKSETPEICEKYVHSS